MTKKEITFRPMFGFGEKPKLVPKLKVDDKPDFIPIGPGFKSVMDKVMAEDRDTTIRDLRAKIEQLEAREAKRKAQTRERTRKARAKE